MTWLAPCGHEGTPIIGTYVMCPMCDGKTSSKPGLPSQVTGNMILLNSNFSHMTPVYKDVVFLVAADEKSVAVPFQYFAFTATQIGFIEHIGFWQTPAKLMSWSLGTFTGGFTSFPVKLATQYSFPVVSQLPWKPGLL